MSNATPSVAAPASLVDHGCLSGLSSGWQFLQPPTENRGDGIDDAVENSLVPHLAAMSEKRGNSNRRRRAHPRFDRLRCCCSMTV